MRMATGFSPARSPRSSASEDCVGHDGLKRARRGAAPVTKLEAAISAASLLRRDRRGRGRPSPRSAPSRNCCARRGLKSVDAVVRHRPTSAPFSTRNTRLGMTVDIDDDARTSRGRTSRGPISGGRQRRAASSCGRSHGARRRAPGRVRDLGARARKRRWRWRPSASDTWSARARAALRRAAPPPRLTRRCSGTSSDRQRTARRSPNASSSTARAGERPPAGAASLQIAATRSSGAAIPKERPIAARRRCSSPGPDRRALGDWRRSRRLRRGHLRPAVRQVGGRRAGEPRVCHGWVTGAATVAPADEHARDRPRDRGREVASSTRRACFSHRSWRRAQNGSATADG